jgi:hypothetical protein
MKHSTTSKVALGLITRRLDDPSPILRFSDNARQHGRPIDRFIVAYSHSVDESTVARLRREVPVDVVRAHGDTGLKERLFALGMSRDEIEGLLAVPSWPSHNEIPYGAYRNAVLIHALLTGMDYLLFFDTDIQPRVLTAYDAQGASWQEVDFVGHHVAHLVRPGVAATSSDYSGYYIIPPISFEGLEDLLEGVGKDMALEYLAKCDEHGCLNLGPQQPGLPTPTDKVLGGNLGLSLDAPRRLAPFFSTTYETGRQCILGRGEDTLLGQAVLQSEGLALDIDLRVFHDTFNDFPHLPDVRRREVRDRFHRACLGWIGRNPFLTWFQVQAGLLDADFDAVIARQRESLEVGGARAAQFLDDPRFARLSDALADSLAVLPDMIARYQRLVESWNVLMSHLVADEVQPASAAEHDGRVPLVA